MSISWMVKNGMNPKTGEALKIKARKVVKFNPGQRLQDVTNGRGERG